MRDISRALNERENPSWVWVMSFLWLGPWKEHKRENEKASVAQGSPLPLFSGLLWHVLLSSITASLPGWTEPVETQSWSRSFSSLKPTMSGIWSQRRKATNAARYHCCNAILLSWFNYCPCGHIVAVTYRPLLGPFFVFCPNCSKATYLYCECTHGNLEKHFTLCSLLENLPPHSTNGRTEIFLRGSLDFILVPFSISLTALELILICHSYLCGKYNRLLVPVS